MTRLIRRSSAALVLAVIAAACGSTQSGRSTISPSETITTTPTSTEGTSTSSTVQLQVTVPDCGAGAFRPPTLLIVCSSGGTMATGIEWSSWSAGGATGVGTVHVQTGTGRANLALGDVQEKGAAGPQFTRLTVNWIGSSPDGHASDSFELGNGS